METPTQFYHERTPKSFNTLLTTDPYFQKHWKIIAPSWKVVQKIIGFNNEDGPFGSEVNYGWFKTYLGGTYAETLKHLETLQVIDRSQSYTVEDEKKDIVGHCKRISVNMKIVEMMIQGEKEFYYKLRTDDVLISKNKRQIRRRGYNTLTYKDDHLQNIKTNCIDGASWEFTELEKEIGTYTLLKQASTWYCLNTYFLQKNYSELKFNDADGRVSNPYTNLPSGIKSLMMIDGRPRLFPLGMEDGLEHIGTPKPVFRPQ